MDARKAGDSVEERCGLELLRHRMRLSGEMNLRIPVITAVRSVKGLPESLKRFG